MEWFSPKDKLPEPGVYVLARLDNVPWNADTDTVFYKVLTCERGLSLKERKQLSKYDSRKYRWSGADESDSNPYPYIWREFGPDQFRGHQVIAWAYIPEYKKED